MRPPLCQIFQGFFSCNEYMYFVHWSMAQGLLDGRLFKREEESFNHKSRNFSQRNDSTLCFVCKCCILAFVKQNPSPIQDSVSGILSMGLFESEIVHMKRTGD